MSQYSDINRIREQAAKHLINKAFSRSIFKLASADGTLCTAKTLKVFPFEDAVDNVFVFLLYNNQIVGEIFIGFNCYDRTKTFIQAFKTKVFGKSHLNTIASHCYAATANSNLKTVVEVYEDDSRPIPENWKGIFTKRVNLSPN